MSYWTKRRRIQSKLNEHLANISRFETLDSANSEEATNSLPLNVNITPSIVNENTWSSVHNNLAETEHNSRQTCTCSTEHYIDDFDYLSDDSCELSEDGCNINGEGDEADNNKDLSYLLAKWATEEGITHSSTGKLLRILQPFHPDLPKDPRTLLSSGKIHRYKTIEGGLYYHFGVRNGIIQQLSNCTADVQHGDTLLLQINCDGLPVFKSNNDQLWPILGMLQNSTQPKPFIIGLFLGPVKPKNAEEYFSDFVEEMTELQSEGFMHNGRQCKTIITSFVCDAPARAFVKNIKGHSGYSACEKCTQVGEYNNKVTFPETDAPLRTDVAFDQMEDKRHHTGKNPLSPLQIPMVSSFPLDYMHLVCLGVMRRLLWLWMKGPNKTRLGLQVKTRISNYLVKLRKYIPKEFARKPRSLFEMERWKATEFRLFLLYTGMVGLKGNVSDAIFKNFLLLSVGISILVSPSLCHPLADYANDLLVIFVKHFGRLYGSDHLVYNVHNLVHIAKDAKRFGPLDKFSAFPYENCLKSIKRLVRKQNHVLQQVVLRLSEKMKVDQETPKTEAIKITEPITLKKKHFHGPLPPGRLFLTSTQYQEAQLGKFTVNTETGNNCVMVGSDVCIVQNILQINKKVYIVYQTFGERKDFFSYPLCSSQLGIHTVSRLSETLNVQDIEEINRKYMLLPYGERQVAMPIIHTVI